MTRDMTLIEDLLAAVEALPGYGDFLEAATLIEYGTDEIFHHIRILLDHGLLMIVPGTNQLGRTKRSRYSLLLTWNGYDYLDALRA
jgi:hypothetical protein